MNSKLEGPNSELICCGLGFEFFFLLSVTEMTKDIVWYDSYMCVCDHEYTSNTAVDDHASICCILAPCHFMADLS